MVGGCRRCRSVKALDTNILARLILADDDAQYASAIALIGQPVWVPTTVWIELGWVLSKRLRLDRAVVSDALRTILLIETVHTADRDGIGWAIERYRAGADWADMIHLITARGVAETFVTFDRGIVAQAGPDTPIAIETLS
nr:type II toxin-antitoxin system VapC family toxin [Sphingomonas sp. CARO-RG-8B-R24-01]